MPTSKYKYRPRFSGLSGTSGMGGKFGSNFKKATQKDELMENVVGTLIAAGTYVVLPSIAKLKGWTGFIVAFVGTWVAGVLTGNKTVRSAAWILGATHLVYAKAGGMFAKSGFGLWRMSGATIGTSPTTPALPMPSVPQTNGLPRPNMNGLSRVGSLQQGSTQRMLPNSNRQVTARPTNTVRGLKDGITMPEMDDRPMQTTRPTSQVSLMPQAMSN